MKKTKGDLSYYMSLDYSIITYKDSYRGEEFIVAEIPELKGCSAQGNTVEEALNELEKAKRVWIESAIKDGEEIPLPEKYEEFSGKLILRINPRVHKKISQAAKGQGISLNAWLNKAIEANLAPKTQEMYAKFKQEILAEVKTEVGGLRKLINEAIVGRQDVQTSYASVAGIDWSFSPSVSMSALKATGVAYTVVGTSAGIPPFRVPQHAAFAEWINDPQFNPPPKLEETG